MINKQERMSFNRDCSSALHLLEHIQQTINNTDDAQLQMQTAEDINMLISVFSNPILRSIVTVEVSLKLNFKVKQVNKHEKHEVNNIETEDYYF